MSDCPLGCDWRYDPFAPCLGAYPVGNHLAPVVYDDTLHVASGLDTPDGRKMATGWHVCTAHPMAPEVLILGPLEEWAPLRQINEAFAALRRS